MLHFANQESFFMKLLCASMSFTMNQSSIVPTVVKNCYHFCLGLLISNRQIGRPRKIKNRLSVDGRPKLDRRHSFN